MPNSRVKRVVAGTFAVRMNMINASPIVRNEARKTWNSNLRGTTRYKTNTDMIDIMLVIMKFMVWISPLK